MYNADFRKNDHVESLKVLFLESGQGRRKPTEKEKEEKKEEVMTDKQTDRQLEFSLVDSTPFVKGSSRNC